MTKKAAIGFVFRLLATNDGADFIKHVSRSDSASFLGWYQSIRVWLGGFPSDHIYHRRYCAQNVLNFNRDGILNWSDNEERSVISEYYSVAFLQSLHNERGSHAWHPRHDQNRGGYSHLLFEINWLRLVYPAVFVRESITHICDWQPCDCLSTCDPNYGDWTRRKISRSVCMPRRVRRELQRAETVTYLQFLRQWTISDARWSMGRKLRLLWTRCKMVPRSSLSFDYHLFQPRQDCSKMQRLLLNVHCRSSGCFYLTYNVLILFLSNCHWAWSSWRTSVRDGHAHFHMASSVIPSPHDRNVFQ